MYTSSVLKAMLGQTTTGVIPTELIPVDRIMQRWAVANGSGCPEESWDDTPKARPPALDDDTAMVVDEIVRKLQPRTKRIVVEWYRRPWPTKTIAAHLNMSPRSLEGCWLQSLNFMRWKFIESRNMTLERLLRMRS